MDGKTISVYDYYRQRYNIALKYPNLPVMNAGKAGWIPMELEFPRQSYG